MFVYVLTSLTTVTLAFMERKNALIDQESFPAFHTPSVSFQMNSEMNWNGQQLSFDQLKATATQWAAENLQLGSSDESVDITRAFTDPSTGLHHCYMTKSAAGLTIRRESSTQIS